jgi:MerR family transcriptional regulator/heat shock protein HspR
VNYYTRKQVVELLEIDEGFLVSLEREEIVLRDAPAGASADFSERMLERVRVAQNLVADLDVNLPGVAVILGMREEMSDLRQRLAELAHELRRTPRG